MSGEVHPSLFIDKSQAKKYANKGASIVQVKRENQKTLTNDHDDENEYGETDDDESDNEIDYAIGAAVLKELSLKESGGLLNATIGKSKTAFINSSLFMAYMIKFDAWLKDYNIPRPYIYICDGCLVHADQATVIWCAERKIFIFFSVPKATQQQQMMDDKVLLEAKKNFNSSLKKLCQEDIQSQPTSVIIKMFGAAMFKSLSPHIITSSFEKCGWFDIEFSADRYQEYGRSAITTASAPLKPSERTELLGQYMAQAIVEAAQASEKKQSAENERDKRKKEKKKLAVGKEILPILLMLKL
jgi:hypothetical protein